MVLGPLMLAAGIALLGWAMSRGEAEVFLAVIIPVISGTGPVFLGGVVLFMLGLPLTFLALSLRQAERMAGEGGPPPGQAPAQAGSPAGQPGPTGGAEFGGVIFIGPIPIVFGKGRRSSRWMMVGSIVFGILLIVFFLGLLL